VEDDGGKTTADAEYIAGDFGAHFNDSNRGMSGYSQSEDDQTGPAPSKVMAGVYHNLGGGLQVWYEGASKDVDKTNMDDDVTHVVGLQINF